MCASSGQGIFYTERDLASADVHSFAAGTAAVCTCRCPGKETPNEDAAAMIPYTDGAMVLAVADGLGGVRAGEVASRTALVTLVKTLSGSAAEGLLLRTALINGIERANQSVIDLGIGAATTLAVIEIQDHTVRPYHVGDSMILAIGQRGKMKLQTVSHSPVGFAVESGMLNEREAMHHEDRHIVSNVIGIPEMRLEVGSTLELAQRDTVLIASDGLFDNLRTDEISARVRVGPIQQAADRLLADSLRRMEKHWEGQPHKPDDLTFIVFRPGKVTGKPSEQAA